MNKYYKNSIIIALIVIVSLVLFATWLNLNFGIGQIVLILAGSYGIFLNLSETSVRQREISLQTEVII